MDSLKYKTIENVIWFLGELYSYDESDIEDNDFDVVCEAELGADSRFSVSIIYLAGDARGVINHQQQRIIELKQELKLNDDEIANSEAIKTSIAVLTDAKIKEQQQEIAELKSTNDNLFLNVSSLKSQADRQVKTYNDQVDEIAELKAMVNSLRDGYKEAIVCMEGEWGEETCAEELKILSLNPTQCLASANQQAIKDAIFNSEKVEFEGSHYVGTYVSLEDLEVNIKQLREGKS